MTNQTIEQAVEEFGKVFPLPRILALSGGKGVERDKMNNWLTQALQAQRDAGARETTAQAEMEMLKRVVEKVRELDKYDYIPVQVKEENPSAWAMYSEGRNKIFKDILASLEKEIINPKE